MACVVLSSSAQDFLIATIAGKDTAGYCCDGGPATNAMLNVPNVLNFDGHSRIVFADCFNSRIRCIGLDDGIISTVAGCDSVGYNGDGIPATNARLRAPEGICTDSSGNIFFSDGLNYRIRKVNSLSGIIQTIAGNGAWGFSGDEGPATDAKISLPVGICIDHKNNVYFSDYENNVIRIINNATGNISTFAGIPYPGYWSGFWAYSGDNGPATSAKFSGPILPFSDQYDNIYICDQWNHAIRKIDAITNVITTIAGTGTAGHTGDGGAATNATLNQPCGMDIDKDGNIYIAEYGDGVIRRIDGATGAITTVAGTGTRGFSGDGGPATAAKMKCGDVKVGTNDIIYIADEDNNRIRIVYSSSLTAPGVQTEKPIAVYPNPVSDVLHVDEAKGYEMSVSNLLGVAIFHASIQERKQAIDIGSLPHGLYIILLTNAAGDHRSYKVVKE